MYGFWLFQANGDRNVDTKEGKVSTNKPAATAKSQLERVLKAVRPQGIGIYSRPAGDSKTRNQAEPLGLSPKKFREGDIRNHGSQANQSRSGWHHRRRARWPHRAWRRNQQPARKREKSGFRRQKEACARHEERHDD